MASEGPTDWRAPGGEATEGATKTAGTFRKEETGSTTAVGAPISDGRRGTQDSGDFTVVLLERSFGSANVDWRFQIVDI